eukprot:gene26372-17466_t
MPLRMAMHYEDRATKVDLLKLETKDSDDRNVLLRDESQWHSLQHTFAMIPDLSVDEDMLKEIKSIFVFYDDDGSGELDEDEFVKVLSFAGFREEEASALFHQINTDGEGGVSLEEFEACGLLRPMEADEEFKRKDAQLWPPDLQTQDKVDPDVISWRLAGHDVQGANKLLFELLMMNSVSLSADPGSMPKPTAATTMTTHCKMAMLYLNLLTDLLYLYPDRRKQAIHFASLADGFRSQIEFWELGLQKSTQKLKKKAGDKTDWFEYGVISNMIQLKYGEQQFMSAALIKEAGVAISSYKPNRGKAITGRFAVGNVYDLSTSYLGNVKGDEEEPESPGASNAGAPSKPVQQGKMTDVVPTGGFKDIKDMVVIKNGYKLPAIAQEESPVNSPRRANRKGEAAATAHVSEGDNKLQGGQSNKGLGSSQQLPAPVDKGREVKPQLQAPSKTGLGSNQQLPAPVTRGRESNPYLPAPAGRRRESKPQIPASSNSGRRPEGRESPTPISVRLRQQKAGVQAPAIRTDEHRTGVQVTATGTGDQKGGVQEGATSTDHQMATAQAAETLTGGHRAGFQAAAACNSDMWARAPAVFNQSGSLVPISKQFHPSAQVDARGQVVMTMRPSFGGDGNTAISRWLNKLVEADLVVDLDSDKWSGSGPPNSIPACGVSLAWLAGFAQSLRSSFNKEKEFSTHQVASRLLTPCLKSFSSQTSPTLWNVIPEEHTGHPTYTVIHPWGSDFLVTVDTLVASLAPPRKTTFGSAGLPPADPTSIYLWVDIVAVPVGASSKAASFDIPVIRDVINGSTEGALFVVDPDLRIMSRVWCLYEANLAISCGAIMRLRVLLPPALDLAEVVHFEQLIRRFDLTKLDTYRPEDKLRIISQIKHSSGLKRFQEGLQEALLRAVRRHLRWGTYIQQAVFCALLVKEGDLNTLQHTLASNPDLTMDMEALLTQQLENAEVDDSVGALKTNVDAIKGWLQLQKAPQSLNLSAAIQQGDPPFQTTSARLRPPNLRVTKSTNPGRIAWHLSSEDFLDAHKLMYKLCVLNMDVLQRHPSLLPKPGSAVGMEAIYEMLERNGTKTKKKILPQMLGKNDQTYLKYGIVSDLIKLKYGNQQCISKGLIKEAGVAISRMVARGRTGRRTGRSNSIDDTIMAVASYKADSPRPKRSLPVLVEDTGPDVCAWRKGRDGLPQTSRKKLTSLSLPAIPMASGGTSGIASGSFLSEASSPTLTQADSPRFIREATTRAKSGVYNIRLPGIGSTAMMRASSPI